jgi:L-threonylcarbamoyladenylate synthase
VGIESTSSIYPRTSTLLRPGRIGIAEIESRWTASNASVSNSPRVPGMLAAHYAPRLPLLLVAVDSLDRVVREQAVWNGSGPARRPRPPDSCSALWQPAATDAQTYAHDLYSLLRDLDHSSCALIVVEAPPKEPEWTAVHDRLVRAAAGSGTDLAFENLTTGAADPT